MSHIRLSESDKVLAFDYTVLWNDDTRPLYNWVGTSVGTVLERFDPKVLEVRRPFYMPYWGYEALKESELTDHGDIFEAVDGRLFCADMLIGCKIAKLNERTHLKVWRPQTYSISPFVTLTGWSKPWHSEREEPV